MTELALIGYIGWTVLLIVLLIAYRAMLVVSNQRSVIFKADGSDVDALGYRITRAHANCVESSVLIIGTLLLAIASKNTEVTDPFALYLLGARVLQTFFHLLSSKPWAIGPRGLFYTVQIVIVVYWLIELAKGAM